MSEPLWNNEQIANAVRAAYANHQHGLPQTIMYGAMVEIRDDLQARITELEAQLAAASQWQPVEDGPIGSFVDVDDDGNTLGVFAGDDYTDWYATADLPDDIRLCRRTPAAGE